MKKASLVAVLAATVVLLQGCAVSQQAQGAGKQDASATTSVPRPDDFPSLDQAFWKQGAFPSRESLRNIRPGMGHDQVRLLLSWPHFQESLWGDREWNYLFHFRTAEDAPVRTCQYMVRFDENGLTTGSWWKDPSCAALISREGRARAD